MIVHLPAASSNSVPRLCTGAPVLSRVLDTVLSAARLIVLAAAPVAFLVACGDDVTGPLWGARSFRLQTVNGNSIPATGGYSVDLVGGRLRVVSDTLLSETLVFAC